MKKKSISKVIALVMSVCCVLTAIPIVANAWPNDEWKKEASWNGDFEVGYEGMEVYGWKVVPFTQALKLGTDTAYANNHTLKTTVENNNKVAQLNRVGGGYAAMASQAIEVTGGQGYQISLDYKTIEVTAVGEKNTAFWGINLVVQQFDANGEETWQHWTIDDKGYGQTVSSEWSSLNQILMMESDTVSAVVYIAIRGEWNSRAKVLLDNVKVQECDTNNVLNGDFENSQGAEGIDGWKLVSCGGSGEYGNQDKTDYPGYYVISKVTEENNGYMKLTPKNKTQGYVLAQSSYVTIQPKQTYTLSYDLKAMGSVEDNGGNSSFVPRVRVYYYDSNKTHISSESVKLTYEELVDWKSFVYEYTAPENAAYITVNFYMGGAWGSGTPKHYIDNVNVQFNYDEQIVNGDFEHTQNSEGVHGWKLLPCGTTGRGDQNQNQTSYPGNYVISKVTEKDNSYMQLAPKDKIKGYVVAQSSYVTIQPNQTYTLSYDLKAEGSIESNGNNNEYAPRVRVYYYDSNKAYISAENALLTYEELVDWKLFNYDYTAPANAAYITVNLYMGGTWDSGTPKHYMDNVNIVKDDCTQIFNGDFEDAQNGEGAYGWKLVAANSAGGGNGSIDATHPNYYVISKVTEEDSSYMKLAPKDKIKGYVVAQSSYVTIQPNQTYTLSYDLKAEGSIESNGNNNEYAPRVRVYYYDSNKAYISAENALLTYEELVDWKSFNYEYTAPTNAAYITVNLYMGGAWNSGTPKHYIDNVEIKSYEKPNWTEESTNYEGTGSVSSDFNANYDIVYTAIDNRKDVLKLYVTREAGCLGAVTYFSEKIPVTGNTAYQTSYELKIKGRDDSETMPGAVYVIRYLNSNGEVCKTERINTSSTSPRSNQDWTTYSKQITTPETAVTAQIGLLIGSVTKDISKNMAYYYDNIVFEKTDIIENGANYLLFEGGDIDGNIGVDVRDLAQWKQLEANKDSEEYNKDADMNKNDKYDSDDITLLMWKLLGKR